MIETGGIWETSAIEGAFGFGNYWQRTCGKVMGENWRKSILKMSVSKEDICSFNVLQNLK